MKISRVYCCCAIRDIEVWAVASKFIPKYIEADSYCVIVPDSDAPAFRWVTDSRFSVIPESEYTGRFEAALASAIEKHGSARFGWYIQQFIKIAAMASGNPDDYVLIWDADTIPVRKISFFSQDGKILFYTGSEHHKPYFESIERLTGLSKAIPQSFIAQCLLGKAGWTAEFLDLVQERSGKDPFQAIIDATDLSEKSGFSEYETLGTFFFSKYKDLFAPSGRKWERNGYSLLGSPLKLEGPHSRFLLRNADFVAFEKWDLKNKQDRQRRRRTQRPIRTRIADLASRAFSKKEKPNLRNDIDKFIGLYFTEKFHKTIIHIGADEGTQNVLLSKTDPFSDENTTWMRVETLKSAAFDCDMRNALLCVDAPGDACAVLAEMDWRRAPKYILVKSEAKTREGLEAFLEEKRFQHLGGSRERLFVRTYSVEA
ncbi:MAG: hypothetical protein H6R00_778 [Proteobacteria bacterium]|nr:hypothetical protein [Pseudomonadota bacterium]